MRGPASRVALYWTPVRGDPLWTAGNVWLGATRSWGVPVPQPELPGIAEITSAPRLYGFHATLRPPMRLATGWEGFIGAAEGVAADQDDFELPRLELTVLGRFSGAMFGRALPKVAPSSRPLRHSDRPPPVAS